MVLKNKSRLFKSEVSLDDDDTAKVKAFCKRWKARCPFASRDDRNERAELFLNYDAKDQTHYPVIKACVFLDAECPPPWEEEWLGITWVALRGRDSLCVVALENDLVRLERNLLLDDENMTTLAMWNALVNEVEGIEDRFFDRSCKRPFSVFTLLSDNNEVCKMSGHEGSSAEYRAKMTSKFLQMEMESGVTFTFDKTIQTAISAFQHLFGREVEAHEIRVFSWKKGDILGKELKQRRKNPTLDELLASIHEPDNDDPDMLTPKKGAAPGALIPAAGVFSKEVSLRPCSKERQGDGSSRSSGKSKVSEKVTHFLEKLKATPSKEGRRSLDERRQRKKKVRKSPSKKAMKEIGDAQDTVEHDAKDDVVPEKDDVDNDAVMQEANIKELELELELDL